MDDEVKTVHATAIEDIEAFSFEIRESLGEIWAAVDRLKAEICIAAGAPAYAWARTIPYPISAALSEIEARARDADASAVGTLQTLLTAEVHSA